MSKEETSDKLELRRLRMEVGMRIRRERTLWNMTQDELSQMLGISTNYLGQIERGSRNLSRKLEDKLCELFHLTHDEFRLKLSQDTFWESGVAESGSIFHHLQEEDLMRLLQSCSEEELQICGHMVRSLLCYLRKNNAKPTELGDEEDYASPDARSGRDPLHGR